MQRRIIALAVEGKSIGAIAALFGCGRSVVHRAVQGGV
jgi:transposase